MKNKPPVRDDVPWAKRQEIPDPQILDAADQYEQACRVLAARPSGVLLPLMNLASMAVELYLKALSAEVIHVQDDLMPEVSRVYAAPAITSNQGHGLVGLLNAMPDDVRTALVAAFDAQLKPTWRTDLQSVLQGLERVPRRVAIRSSTASTSLNTISGTSSGWPGSSHASFGRFRRRIASCGRKAA